MKPGGIFDLERKEQPVIRVVFDKQDNRRFVFADHGAPRW
jgi:hypothetical protein